MPRSLLLLASSTLRSLAFVLAAIAALVVLNDCAWAIEKPLCYDAKPPCSDTIICIDDDTNCTSSPPEMPTFCVCVKVGD